MKTVRIIIAGLTMALSAGLAHGAGQEKPSPGPAKSPAGQEIVTDSRKLLEEVLMARLTRELALDESQTVLLMRHMVEYRDRMIALRRERAEKMRDLRQAVRESKDEAHIAGLLEGVVAINQKYSVARDDILNFNGFELTTWQKARLLLFLNDFEGDMKRLLRRAQERKAGGQKDSAKAASDEPSSAPDDAGADAKHKKSEPKSEGTDGGG